jgi:hypothetical protein
VRLKIRVCGSQQYHPIGHHAPLWKKKKSLLENHFGLISVHGLLGAPTQNLTRKPQ